MPNMPDLRLFYKGCSIAGWKGDKGWSFSTPQQNRKNKNGQGYSQAKYLIDWDAGSDLVKMAAVLLVVCEHLDKQHEIGEAAIEVRDILKKALAESGGGKVAASKEDDELPF